SVIKQPDSESLCEDQGELHGLLDLMSENEILPDERNSTVTNKSKSHEGNQSNPDTLNPCPADCGLSNAEELLENQQPEIQSRPSPPEGAVAPEGALSSCTVVEGLLFPIEYYVRTTRRMSNCQRKVDLDAVILSQLGKSKKGQRSKIKQKDANSDQPSQERAEGDLESGVVPLPFLAAENDPANSSSCEKSLPVPSSSTSLGFISQKSIISTRRKQIRSQGKQKRRRKSACKALVHPVSQELIENLDIVVTGESSALLPNENQSKKENCNANLEKSSSDEGISRGHRCRVGSEHPAVLGLPAVDPNPSCSLFFRSLQWLIPRLGIRDFHLPNEEFGVLKLEKLESSPVNDLEDFVLSVSGGGVAPEDTPGAPMNSEEKSFTSNLISPSKPRLPKIPRVESPASKKELSTHELLFTPMGTVLAGASTQPESQISSSVFPAVGATPGVLPSAHSEVLCNTPSVPALQEIPPSSRGAVQVLRNEAHEHPAMSLHLDICGAGATRNEEEQGTGDAMKEEEKGAMFSLAAEAGPDNKSDEAVTLHQYQQSESKEQGSCRASPKQKKDAAEQLAPVLSDGPGEENLQLVSELKDSSGSCAVDVSTVWWEADGCRELRVVTASESSVSLWEPLAHDRWGKVYTWQLGEIPVIQIIPLPDTCNLVCVALGELEIGEIRLLLYSSEGDSFKHSLVKTGNIKAVVGLKDQRLVSSSRTLQEQQVEMVLLSETGGSRDCQTLMPPEETVTAFAEVEGMREALVGTTAANSIVVWSVNLKTGQLLRKMHAGYSYPASICHRAYSDSGLLFVVLSHPHAKESESCGNLAFRVVAFNPKTGRSKGVMFSSLPPDHVGRQVLELGWYLEGDVCDTVGAAVLTSGAVAVWDLLQGQCVAVLPPGPTGRWALARWATGARLLAGQHDGTVRLYRYQQAQPGAA
ncbi:PALB2 protein, partial [Sapayoa aenigma]|nr:PALB2 protein [Sapayoa aenigma]